MIFRLPKSTATIEKRGEKKLKTSVFFSPTWKGQSRDESEAGKKTKRLQLKVFLFHVLVERRRRKKFPRDLCRQKSSVTNKTKEEMKGGKKTFLTKQILIRHFSSCFLLFFFFQLSGYLQKWHKPLKMGGKVKDVKKCTTMGWELRSLRYASEGLIGKVIVVGCWCLVTR